MGGLIPNDNDAEVIDKLNAQFHGDKLSKLRKHIHDKDDDFFARGRHLHRIAHRLNIFPNSGSRPKGRWYVFLRDLIGTTNQNQILDALRNFVGDPAHAVDSHPCAGIRFWARFNPAPNPPDYVVDVVQESPDASGKFWVTITLLCDHEILQSVGGDPSDPDEDGDEKRPVHPIPLAPAKRARKHGKKPGYGKKPVKKTPKKAVRKAAKKKK
jgi:hypothetical protein